MLKFKNFAAGLLASSITASSTSIVLGSGDGAKFPAISGGDTFSCVLTDGTNWEEVLVTAVSGDTLTVTRAIDGVAQSWNAGTVVELRVTKFVLQSFSQSMALQRRHAVAGAYSYCGTSPVGTAESAAGWTIKRITVAADGSTTVATASGAWDNRASLTYT